MNAVISKHLLILGALLIGSIALIIWGATAGDRSGARRVAARREVTPEFEPAPNQFRDEYGRPM